jgi:hypothetical protein
MPEQSAHDWLQPKLTALVADAESSGIARDVVVAVITDLINGPLFAPPVPKPDDDWNRDKGEPDYMVNENAPLSAEALASAPVHNPLSHLDLNNQNY